MRTIFAAIAIIASVSAAQVAAAPVKTTITFDEFTTADDYTVHDSITSKGFIFTDTIPNSLLISGKDAVINEDPGGATLYNNSPQSIITLQEQSGAPFDLYSLQFGDVFNGAVVDPIAGYTDGRVLLEFVYASGGGEIDSLYTPLEAGLKTYTFNMKDLAYFEYKPVGTTGGSIQADNFVVSNFFATPPPVPEPATWVMMVIGMGLMGAIMRRNVTHRATPILGQITSFAPLKWALWSLPGRSLSIELRRWPRGCSGF